MNFLTIFRLKTMVNYMNVQFYQIVYGIITFYFVLHFLLLIYHCFSMNTKFEISQKFIQISSISQFIINHIFYLPFLGIFRYF